MSGTQPPQVTPTTLPAATSTPAATQAATPAAEERVVELEWPPQMRLGDSDLIRLSLIPFKDGYLVTTEFADHQTVTSTVPVARSGGYDLSAVARLDATGFVFSPPGEQALGLPPEEPATWRWTLTPRTAGQHRLSIALRLRWTPQPGNPNPLRETQIYSKGLEVRVTSFFGLTTRQAAFTGLVGLAFGSTLSLPLAAYLLRPRRKLLQGVQANPALVIEPHPSLTLAPEDAALLRALFRRYARLVLEAEFRSGYSGARTFLALPIRADGRADAYTIAKLGERAVIQREFENYETFVKDTLPPITARIQEVPVTRHDLAYGKSSLSPSKAALRYTFIGEPGRSPVSLREALIADPDPSWLEKLFSTFGPNWWMQRHPYTFRLAAEYDRMLPAHYVLAPAGEKKKEAERKVLDGRDAPGKMRSEIGDCVSLRHFAPVERRADGKSLSLIGEARPGQPPLRVRWLSLDEPGGATARVVATRASLLCEFVTGFELCGL
ncbi:MAG: hypothetical protein ACRDH2_15765, partial [Anaerolineales bacterium]